MTLMSQLWPGNAQCWTLTVETKEWYAVAYVDVVVNHHKQVWLRSYSLCTAVASPTGPEPQNTAAQLDKPIAALRARSCSYS